jgi:hypothetical protein
MPPACSAGKNFQKIQTAIAGGHDFAGCDAARQKRDWACGSSFHEIRG